MPFFADPVLGNVAVPPEATPEDVEQALMPLRQQAQQRSIAMQGVSMFGRGIADVLAPSTQPKPVSPVAAMAMGANYQPFRQGQMQQQVAAQQQAQSQERNTLAERQMLMQATAAEKDRQAQLQYQTLQLNNQEKARKIQEKQLTLAEQAQNNDNAKQAREAKKALEPQYERDSTLGGVWVANPDGGAPVFQPDTEAQKMIAARQAAYRGGGGGGGGKAVGGQTGMVWNSKLGQYGTVKDGVWTPLGIAGGQADPNAADRAKLESEIFLYLVKEEGVPETEAAQRARAGALAMRPMPADPNAPPSPPAPVQDVYPQAYQILKELAAAGDPNAVARLSDMEARLADGRARIVGGQPAQAPGAPQPAAQPVSEVPAPEVPPPPKYPLSPKVVVSERPRTMAPVSFGGIRDTLRGKPQQPQPMTEAEFRAREANAGQPWAVQGGWRPVSDPNDLGRAGVDPNVPVAPAPVPVPAPANWPEGVPLPGTVVDGYEIVVGADGRPAKRKVQ